jgi:dTDP-glucose 4,6-dehydratase
MNDVLITGGSGFVGYWLWKTACDKLMDIVTRPMNQIIYNNAAAWPHSCKYIIHLAPVLPDKVIELAKRCNARILFASSGAVYANPLNDYGKMKLESENMLLASGLDVRIARMFTFCGSHLKWDNFAIGQFIRDAVNGGPIRILGDGKTVRSYMYGSDLGEWLWKILLDGEPGAIYDVGSEYPVTIQHLAEEVSYNFDKTPEIVIENKMSEERQKWYLPTTVRTQNELGLHVKIGFKEAIKRSVEDYKREN